MQTTHTLSANDISLNQRPEEAARKDGRVKESPRWIWIGTGLVGVLIALSFWRTELGLASRTGRASAAAVDPTDSGRPRSQERVDASIPDGVLVAGQGDVDVEGGTVNLSPRTFGEVAAVPVNEGDVVPADGILLRLDDRAVRIQVEQARQAIAEAEIKLVLAKLAPKEFLLRKQLAAESVIGAELKSRIQRRQLEQTESLGAAVAPEAPKNARDALSAADSELRARRIQQGQLDLERPDETVKLAELSLQNARSKLAAAEESLAAFTLRAPIKGMVLRIYAGVGEVLGANARTPALVFCPARPRIVRCEIEQEFIERVKVGLSAEVVDDSTGASVGAGSVERLSPWVAPRRILLDDPSARNDVRTIECIVRLNKEMTPLRIGQHVRVMIRADGAGKR